MNKYIEITLTVVLGSIEFAVDTARSFGNFLLKVNTACLNKINSIPNPQFLKDLEKSSPIEKVTYSFANTTRGHLEKYLLADTDAEKESALKSLQVTYPFK